MVKQNAWRNVGLSPTFFVFDYRLSIFLLPICFRAFTWWPYVLFLVSALYFHYLNYRGMNVSNFLRWIGYKIVGKKAYGKPKWMRPRNVF